MNREDPISIELFEKHIKFSNGLICVDIHLNPFSFTYINEENGNILFDRMQFFIELSREHAKGEKVTWNMGSTDFIYRLHDEGKSLIAKGKGKSIAILLEAPKRNIACWLRFCLLEEKTYVLSNLKVINKNTFPVYIKHIHVLCIDSNWQGAKTYLDGQFKDLRIYHNGYQSWSLTRVFSLNERVHVPALKLGQYPTHMNS